VVIYTFFRRTRPRSVHPKSFNTLNPFNRPLLELAQHGWLSTFESAFGNLPRNALVKVRLLGPKFRAKNTLKRAISFPIFTLFILLLL